MHAPTRYIGRFAPSPTGPLHAGSLVAALASWLDAKAHGGEWLVRLEDVDTPRCMPGMDRVILQQLARCGLYPDQPPVWQSQRTALYQRALGQLVTQGLAYPCTCSRKAIETALSRLGQGRTRHGELVYPGTCRTGPHDIAARPDKTGVAWRLRTDIHMQNGRLALVKYDDYAIKNIASSITHWTDRRLGAQQQDVQAEVGDFVLKRADGCFSYQLAVVVDDAAQGVTDVVRGADLADNTARQILLQQCLGLATPRYLHTPLVLGANGEKLSKQNGAPPLDTTDPLAALGSAARVLGLPEQRGSTADALSAWVRAWSVDGQPLCDPVR
jgi:glutamyl-Q tRNA(Asp) synthetase